MFHYLMVFATLNWKHSVSSVCSLLGLLNHFLICFFLILLVQVQLSFFFSPILSLKKLRCFAINSSLFYSIFSFNSFIFVFFLGWEQAFYLVWLYLIIIFWLNFFFVNLVFFDWKLLEKFKLRLNLWDKSFF